jgi:hypothetical protein
VFGVIKNSCVSVPVKKKGKVKGFCSVLLKKETYVRSPQFSIAPASKSGIAAWNGVV